MYRKKLFLESYVSKILDLLYPPKCMICSDIIPLSEERWICKYCNDNNRLEYIDDNKCKICGSKISEGIDICSTCIGLNVYFDYNIAIFEYDNILQDIIYKFKYGKNGIYGKGLGYFISMRLLKDIDNYKDIDYIVPVPIHKKRRKKRGFNQVDIIANEVSKNVNIKMRKDILFRVKNTKAQSGLSRVGRMNNIKGAFELNPKCDIKNKKILLIDDIYTTGSTLNECAKILVLSGASMVKTVTVGIVSENKHKCK